MVNSVTREAKEEQMETLIEFKNILEPLKSEPMLLVLTVLVIATVFIKWDYLQHGHLGRFTFFARAAQITNNNKRDIFLPVFFQSCQL
jgi:hypothetical protein